MIAVILVKFLLYFFFLLKMLLNCKHPQNSYHVTLGGLQIIELFSNLRGEDK